MRRFIAGKFIILHATFTRNIQKCQQTHETFLVQNNAFNRDKNCGLECRLKPKKYLYKMQIQNYPIV